MASGVKIGEAFIEVTADSTGAFKGVGAAAKTEGGKSGGFFKGAFMKGLAGMGTAIAGVFAVDKVISFFGGAIGGASDLHEEIQKSEVIFGSSAGTIRSWAQDAATNVGLTEAEALSATGTFGNMFTQLGVGQSEAAGLSQEVVQLSADLGSFNNLPTAEVTDMMSAAFRGEYDSLQRLIPGINAAAVEQEALAMTGKTSAASLTEQEKAMAVLSIVQRDGAAAQGDFARTSDGLANKTKIAKAEFGNMTAAIGSALLPAATSFMSFVTSSLIPGLYSIGDYITGTVVPALQDFGNKFMENLPLITKIGTVIGVILLPALIRLGVQATISAAKQVAAWVASGAGAIKTGVIYIAQSALMVARWVAMGVAATVNAAIVVAGWVLMGVQSLIQAARMAAAWVIAMGPIGWVIAAVIGLVVLIIANWDTVKAVTVAVFSAVVGFLKSAWEAIKTAVGIAINFVLTIITTVFNSIKSFITTVWNGIVAFFGLVWQGIVLVVTTYINIYVTIITTVFNFVKSVITTIWNGIKAFFGLVWAGIVLVVTTYINIVRTIITTVFNVIKTGITVIWNTIKNVITTVWNGIKAAITTALNAVKAVVSRVFNAVKSFITTVINNIKATISTVFNAIKATISRILNNVKATVSRIFNAIKSTITSIINNTKSTISNVFNAIKSTISNVLNSARSTVSNIFNGIKSTISNAVNAIRSTVSRVFSTLGGIMTGAFNGVSGTIKSVINGVISGINGAIGGINRMISTANKVPGVSIPSMGSIPYLAKGGTIRSSGMAMVGEEGPELVTLPRGATVHPNGTGPGISTPTSSTKNVNLNVYGNVNEPVDVDMILSKMTFATSRL